MENQTYQAQTPQQVQPPKYYPQYQVKQKQLMTKGQGTAIIILLTIIAIPTILSMIVCMILLLSISASVGGVAGMF